MPWKQTQPMYDYRLQAWDTVAKTLMHLSDVGGGLGMTEMQTGTVWAYASAFHEMIKEEKARPETFSLFTIERNALLLFDASLGEEFLVALQSAEAVLFGTVISSAGEAPDPSALDETILNNDFSDLLAQVGFRKDVAKKWLVKQHTLPAEQRGKVEAKMKQVIDMWNTLLYQMSHIGAVIGVTPSAIPSYDPEDIEALLIGKKNTMNMLRLARSFSELSRSYPIDVTTVMAPIFSDALVRDREIYSWEDIFLLTLMLHTAYARFELLSSEIQTLLLQTFYYRAIVLGVPVRESLKNALHGTRTVLSFTQLTERLLNAMDANIERVPTEAKPQGQRLLGLVAQDCLKNANGTAATEDQINIFVHTMYGATPSAALFMSWLEEALSVYMRIRDGDLIEKNRGGELSKREQYLNDLVWLSAMFGIGKAGASDIVTYFKEEHPRVPLVAFFRRLKEAVNLKEDVAVENCMEISEALQSAGVIPKDQDIITFHEEDGKFHWNETLLS